MLDDLDSSLKQLLIHELSDLQRSAETSLTICFDSPTEGTIRQRPAINFFLYDVRENLDLRNTEWTIQHRTDGTAVKQRPPARIDCSYLITTWVSSDDPQQEHHLLGMVMKLLLRYRTLPPAVLQGSLRGLEPLPIVVAMRSGYLQSLSETWQALGGLSKASLNCTITIAVSMEEPEVEVPLVLNRNFNLHRIS